MLSLCTPAATTCLHDSCRRYEFSMLIEVGSEDKVYQLARRRLSGQGIGPRHVEELIGTASEPDIASCIHVLLDTIDEWPEITIVESHVRPGSVHPAPS